MKAYEYVPVLFALVIESILQILTALHRFPLRIALVAPLFDFDIWFCILVLIALVLRKAWAHIVFAVWNLLFSGLMIAYAFQHKSAFSGSLELAVFYDSLAGLSLFFFVKRQIAKKS